VTDTAASAVAEPGTLVHAALQALDEAGRARLLPQLERTATEYGDYPVGDRLRKLIVTAGSDEVPYALIEDASEVGRALRAALADAGEPDPAKARLIRLLAGYPAGGRPGGRADRAPGLRGPRRPAPQVAARGGQARGRRNPGRRQQGRQGHPHHHRQ
jgi:hypothetical protein